MLAKKYRLKSRPLFKRTLNSGARLCANRCFVVYTVPASDERPQHPPRFGFIVSRKVHLRANRRNRIKRRLREIARRDIVPSGRASACAAIVIIARSGMLQASYAEIRHLIMGCFTQRAGVS